MNLNSQEKQYTQIKQIISLFFQLTKIRIAFIDPTLHVITSEGLLADPTNSTNYFEKKKNLIFFPIVTNDRLNGLFLADKSDITVNMLSLNQKSLESVANEVLNTYYQRVLILSPLTKDEINQDLQLFNLLINNSHNATPLVPIKNSTSPITTRNKGVNDIDIALNYIDQNITKKLTLLTVANNAYLSPAYLSRLFKENFKINFSDYIRLRKITLAQNKLMTTTQSINSIANNLGFSRANYFNKVFKETTNLTPLQFRKHYSGSKKIYTIYRDLTWNDNISVYAASKRFFQQQGIDLKEKDVNGRPCIVAIEDLSSLGNASGWVFLVDGIQPPIFPSELYVKDKTVIQWIYVHIS